MQSIILIILVLVAIAIVALILLQQGKGASMGAAFGSGASQTVFGSRGSAPFMFKLTGGLAAAFFIICIALNYMSAHPGGAVQKRTVPLTPITPVKSRTTQPSTQGIVPSVPNSGKKEGVVPSVPVKKKSQ